MTSTNEFDQTVIDSVHHWLDRPDDEASQQHLVDLVVSSFTRDEPSEITRTMKLFGAIHNLIEPITWIQLDQQVTQSIASLLIDSIHPALPEEHHLKLSDTIIDIIWTLEQSIDNGVLPIIDSDSLDQIEEDMQIDSEGVEVVDDATSLAARAEQQRAKVVQQVRQDLGFFVKALCDTNVLSVSDVEQRLDISTLTIPTLNLIPNAQVFTRLEIRARTGLFYKQQKFNLLREESEGYSKLAVELLTNSGPPQSTEDGRSVESSEQRMKRANTALDKIKSLIGNFDLDPDRTIDLILDAFSDQVVEHYQFFLDLITISPWAPPSARKNNSTSNKGKEKELAVDIGLEQDQGSRVMAQILGFKFKFYQTEGVGETPEKLYLMTALLLWHDLVKFADLWPHLSPGDTILSKIESQYRDDQEKAAASVGGGNALAIAGALVDDEAPSSKGSSSSASTSAAAAAKAAEPRELPNQRLGLVRAMLTLGDLGHALFVLAQYPTLVMANPDVVQLLNRLLTVSLTPAYEATVSIRLKTSADRLAELSALKLVFDPTTKKLVKASPKPRVLTAEAIPTLIPNKESVFFFPDWQSRLPKCGDIDEVLIALEKTYAPVLGSFLSLDVSVYTRLCRMCAYDLKSSQARLSRWIVVIRQILMPGLSLLKDNSPAALMLWDVLSLLTIEQRYQLYGEWKDALYRRIPALGVRKAETEREVKMNLRRLSTDNVKRLGKNLAKSAHNNPVITFTVILNQVQSYDNLILPVVEAARYLSDLSYDVLTYSVLDALTSSKSKTKDDGTSSALWLQSLATFTGQLYRRWSSLESSLGMVIQYLLNQLVTGNSKDLIILRELITKMTGIEPFADLSDNQVLSLAGGKVLRSEVFFQTEISQASKSKETALTTSSKDRLGRVLKRTGLSMPLLINIALQRQACISMDAHLKSLGALFDQNHAILFQFTELLLAISNEEDHADQLPSIRELVLRFGIEPAIGFEIGRPKLRRAMKKFDEIASAKEIEKKKADLKAKLEKERAAKAEAENKEKGDGKVDEEEQSKKESEGEEKEEEEDAKMDDIVIAIIKEEAIKEAVTDEVIGDVAMADGPGSDAPLSPSKASTWHPGLLDVIETAEELLPAEIKATMGAPFYVTFWQLTLYDILYPKERYDAEIDRLTKMQRETNDSSLSSDVKGKFVQNILALANRLLKEAEEHRLARAVVSRRLSREAKNWFVDIRNKEKRKILMDGIIQHCIHPRAKLSLPDAVFSYQFVKRLHSMNTNGFHSVLFYDCLLHRHLVPIIYSCSENEARNYARFLHDVLQDVHRWYTSEEKYKTEAVGTGLCGFSRSPPEVFTSSIKSEECFAPTDFRAVVEKWNERMVVGFAQGFETGEYMHIKNSILVLTKVAAYFPLEYNSGVKLEAAIEALLKAEQRDDLKILASGYKAVLSKRRKYWSNQPPPPPPPSAPKVKAVEAVSKDSTAASAPSSASSSARPSPAPSGPAAATASRANTSSSSSATPASAPAEETSTSSRSQPASSLPSRPSLSTSADREPSRNASYDARSTNRPHDRYASNAPAMTTSSSRDGSRNDLPSRPNGSSRHEPVSSHNNSNSTTRSDTNGLPPRPGQSAQSRSSTASAVAPAPTESELRAKVVASSRNASSSMRPPTSTSTNTPPRARSPASDRNAVPSSLPPTNLSHSSQQAQRNGPPSRPSSTPTSPRGGVRDRDQQERSEPSSRRRSSRERSVESNRSSNSRRDTGSSAAPSSSTTKDESLSRSSTRDAGKDRREETDRERDRDREKSRSHHESSSSRTARRSGATSADDDYGSRKRIDRKEEDRKKDDKARSDDRRSGRRSAEGSSRRSGAAGEESRAADVQDAARDPKRHSDDREADKRHSTRSSRDPTPPPKVSSLFDRMKAPTDQPPSRDSPTSIRLNERDDRRESGGPKDRDRDREKETQRDRDIRDRDARDHDTRTRSAVLPSDLNTSKPRDLSPRVDRSRRDDFPRAAGSAPTSTLANAPSASLSIRGGGSGSARLLGQGGMTTRNDPPSSYAPRRDAPSGSNGLSGSSGPGALSGPSGPPRIIDDFGDSRKRMADGPTTLSVKRLRHDNPPPLPQPPPRGYGYPLSQGDRDARPPGPNGPPIIRGERYAAAPPPDARNNFESRNFEGRNSDRGRRR